MRRLGGRSPGRWWTIRNRGAGPLRRLALARLVSLTGGGAAYVGIVYLIFDKTHSALWITAVMLATTGAQSVFLPYAGALVDRLGRKPVMVASDLACVVLFCLLAQDWSVTGLVVLAGLASLAEAPFLPASSAAVPSLVDDSELSAANGTMSTASSLGRALGPVLAVPVLAVGGPSLVFLANAVTFLVSAVLVLSVPLPGFVGAAAQRGGKAIAQGVRHVRSTPAVRFLLVSSLTAYVATTFAMVAEPLLADSFGAGAVGYSLMSAGWGSGLVLGSWLAGRLLSASSEPRALVVGRLVMGAGITAVPLAPWFPLVPALMVCGGFGSGLLMVAMFSQLQRNTPDALRGRVFALFESVGTAGFVVGVLLAGVLVETVGVRPSYLLAGVGTLFAAVPLYANLRRHATELAH